MTLSIRVADQVRLPRYSAGSDWGVERRLLAQLGDLRLIWWTGHSGWICRGQSGHHPGELMVQSISSPHSYTTLRDEKAGSTRLTAILKSEVGQKFIREHFCDDEAAVLAVDPRKTIYITRRRQ